MKLLEEIRADREKIKALARVIAHLMGDGTVSKKYFAYYNKNQYLLDKFEIDLHALFGKIHCIKGT